jgi:hypothetical protein
MRLVATWCKSTTSSPIGPPAPQIIFPSARTCSRGMTARNNSHLRQQEFSSGLLFDVKKCPLGDRRILGLRHERGNDFNPHRGGGDTVSQFLVPNCDIMIPSFGHLTACSEFSGPGWIWASCHWIGDVNWAHRFRG